MTALPSSTVKSWFISEFRRNPPGDVRANQGCQHGRGVAVVTEPRSLATTGLSYLINRRNEGQEVNRKRQRGLFRVIKDNEQHTPNPLCLLGH